MKIIEQYEDSCLILLSRNEWVQLGDRHGWLTQYQQEELYPPNSPATRPRYPTGDRMTVRIVAEQGEAWAIYIAGEAGVEGKPDYEEQRLCVLPSHQHALAVKALLDDMAERIAQGRDREDVLERRLRGTNRT